MSKMPKYASHEEHIAELYRRIDVLHDRLDSMKLVLSVLYQSSTNQAFLAELTQQAYQSTQKHGVNANLVYLLQALSEISTQQLSEPTADADDSNDSSPVGEP